MGLILTRKSILIHTVTKRRNCVADHLVNHFSKHHFEATSGETRVAQGPVHHWDEADRIAKERSVRQLIKRRRSREGHFGSGLFNDPAWDLLLELYSAKLAQCRCTVSGIVDASSVSPTTGLRWLDRLAQKGLVTRMADRFDMRRTFVELTEEGESVMNDYFRCAHGNLAGS